LIPSSGEWQFMSEALLQDNDKCNELEDDRESCLHILTWMASRFTNHTISGGGASRFLRAFDEEYGDGDGIKGGDLKRDFSSLAKYRVSSSSIVDHSWTNLSKSSPKYLPLVTRIHHQLWTLSPLKKRGQPTFLPLSRPG
jgi:hypothetical protein